MKIYSILIVSFMILLLSGCATKRVPLSDYLRQQHSLDEAELQQLQVYVSTSIILERVVDSTGSDIVEGELNIFGEKLEQLIIKPKTPGIILEATDNWTKVSFLEGTWLIFGTIDPGDRTDPWGGQYALFAQKWQQGVGFLEFDGKTYRAIKSSGSAVLEIRQKDLKNAVTDKTKLPGVIVDY